MKVYDVDLYDYFKVKKPDGGEGILTCYISDIAKEVNENRKSPAMLVLPGGGYAYTSYREAEPIALRYSAFGFKSFVLHYSVAPIKFPYAITEAVMAMNYIRLNAEELKIDPEKVTAVGFSAGGHLCAMLGSYADGKEVKELFNPKTNSKPNAVILSYPVITSTGKAHFGSFNNLCGEENEELKLKLSIENFIDKNSAPAFIWATYDDGAVPVKNSLVVATAYDDAGVPYSLHIYGKGWHGNSLGDRTVYGKTFEDAKKAASVSIGEWVRLSIEWLEELGLYIKD